MVGQSAGLKTSDLRRSTNLLSEFPRRRESRDKFMLGVPRYTFGEVIGLSGEESTEIGDAGVI
jgi:hypothetical protein